MPDRERHDERRHQHRRGFRAAFTNRRPDAEPTHPRTPDTPARQVWTPEQVRALGMTTDLTTAAAIIGIGRTLAYDLARTGDFPVRILRLGGRVVVPVADLLAFLGEPDRNGD
jgi:hypothetical protein